MKRNQFKNILKQKINELAFQYLLEKRGKKGCEIEYLSLRMSDYLAPITALTISEKQEMFAIKNRMVQIRYNFPNNKKSETCLCGQEENMEHIYLCKILNKEKEQLIPYKKIFNGNIREQITIFKIFQKNMKERENILNKEKQNNEKSPCDPVR